MPARRYPGREEGYRIMNTKRLLAITLASVAVIGWTASPVIAADESKVKSATRQVESGAKQIGDGKVGTGVEQTDKGVVNTVVEGTKFTGEQVKEAGQAAAAPAKTAWQHPEGGT